jgi:hypothetical protein
VAVEYTLTSEDVTSARLLGLGMRPKSEGVVVLLLLGVLFVLTLSAWNFRALPVMIISVVVAGAIRAGAMVKAQDGAIAAFRSNPILRQRTSALWDETGVTIQPTGFDATHLPWNQLRELREDGRIVLLILRSGIFHGIPKRAFPDVATLSELQSLAKSKIGAT